MSVRAELPLSVRHQCALAAVAAARGSGSMAPVVPAGECRTGAAVAPQGHWSPPAGPGPLATVGSGLVLLPAPAALGLRRAGSGSGEKGDRAVG